MSQMSIAGKKITENEGIKMPILGIGTDLVAFERMERMLRDFPIRFPVRCLAQSEQEELTQKTSQLSRTSFCAKRMAAKEACAKALGTGFSNGIRLRDIAVLSASGGAPEIKLSGQALRQLESLAGPDKTPIIHVSLTDEPPYAQAFVVIESGV